MLHVVICLVYLQVEVRGKNPDFQHEYNAQRPQKDIEPQIKM